jgi:hypothetical protein
MTRGGIRVLYLDYAGFKSDVGALRAEVEAADRVICAQPLRSVHALADLRDTVATAAVVDLFKHSATQTKPHVAKMALVGIHGLKKFLAEMVARVSGQQMRAFDTEDEAFAWLAGERVEAGVLLGPRA